MNRSNRSSWRCAVQWTSSSHAAHGCRRPLAKPSLLRNNPDGTLEIHGLTSSKTQIFCELTVYQGIVMKEPVPDFPFRTWKSVELPQ